MPVSGVKSANAASICDLLRLAGFLTVNTLGDQPLGLAFPVSRGETARQSRVVPDARVVRPGLAQAGEDLTGLSVVLLLEVIDARLQQPHRRWDLAWWLAGNRSPGFLALIRRLLCAGAGVDVVPQGGDLIPHALQVGRQGCDLAAVLIDLSGQRVDSQAQSINLFRYLVHHGKPLFQWLEVLRRDCLGKPIDSRLELVKLAAEIIQSSYGVRGLRLRGIRLRLLDVRLAFLHSVLCEHRAQVIDVRPGAGASHEESQDAGRQDCTET